MEFKFNGKARSLVIFCMEDTRALTLEKFYIYVYKYTDKMIDCHEFLRTFAWHDIMRVEDVMYGMQYVMPTI